MTFFSSIVKVMKKSETKAEKESQAAGNPEDLDHKDDLRHQVGNQRVKYFMKLRVNVIR